MQSVAREVWLDRGSGPPPPSSAAFGELEMAWRERVLRERERDKHKVDRQIARKSNWMRYGRSRGASKKKL